MMELSHSLTLNEGTLQQLPADKKPLFVFEWLRFLDKVLTAAQKSDIKECQKTLVTQLTNLIHDSPGPPARRLLARCLATLFSVGDTFLLFETVNKCNDILKVKDDSPSYLPTRLAAICCLGSMYEKLGRMMGRSYEETVQTLIRSLKNAESQTRLEIITTLEKICVGMGSAASASVREVSRACRQMLVSERSAPVRSCAARTLTKLLTLTTLTHAELDTTSSACIRALDGSCYQVRYAVAELLGSLIAATQAEEGANTPQGKGRPGTQSAQQNKSTKNVTSLEEALNILMGGFLRGGSSFLKGEIIKAGSGVNREVRVGITHAYVIFVQKMGGRWLERNMSTFLNHILDLVANPKAASSHMDAVYSRKCINYILRSTLGKMLGEKAQASACKDIIQIIVKQMNSIDFSPENAKDCNQETLFSQHLLVCALSEAGELIQTLGTSAQTLLLDNALNMVEAISTVLVHPCQAARLAAAWCLRCVCVAVPSQITPLIDKCVDALDSMRTSPEAISGWSATLAAALGAVRCSALGVPHARGKIAFNAAEQLLRSAGQSSRLSNARTNAGWLIVGAICTLGVPVVRGLLPRMLLLWRNSFPRSNKELESEKARGDAFTWQVTLEGRAGALSALHSLLAHCSQLAHNDETAKRLMQPIDGALAVLTSIQGVVRQYGAQLKAPCALLRLRLCECAALLPPAPAAAPPLLRALAADLTLADVNASPLATGMLLKAGHPRDAILLGPAGWIFDTDHANIEDQLVSSLIASGSGALEHDPCCLYRPLLPDQSCPGPPPLGVAVIDASVLLFGQIFPRAANKHRLQMIEHFSECIRVAKGTRQEAIQINVYTALLLGLKGLSDMKSSLGQEDVRNSTTNLVVAGLSSQSVWVRCAAAQCAGRLCGATDGGGDALTARLWSAARAGKGASQRAGAAAALGAAHRARGGAAAAAGGAGAQGGPGATLSVLLAFAQDTGSVEVQVWSLHALSLIADAGGPMFRGFVEPALSLALKLLFSVPAFHEDIHRCVGRLLSALITVVGPELQGNGASTCSVRSMFLCACSVMAEWGAAPAQAEAVGCLQQLHLFAPKHLNLATLVPTLCRNLSSQHLVLRRAALSCLRQLTQREAADVCRHALILADEKEKRDSYYGVQITETGLCGALFTLLDVESDSCAIGHARDTLAAALQPAAALPPTAPASLTHCLTLCKRVLTKGQDELCNTELEAETEEDNDHAEFHAESKLEQATHPPIQPRWPTRVFAMECVQKIMSSCEATSQPHFDLIKAKKQLANNPNSEFLVMHLGELVRAALVAATGDTDPLRLAGLSTLQLIIHKFARAAEPDFPGHLLLEQYQAQVAAALRPAFAADTPSHVTAAACDVCSAWIGSGVARDINDLRRVHQLLVSSLNKLNTKANTTQIYNESMSTLEKLSILKAWAEIYIVAMVSNGSAPGSYVKQLDNQQPEDPMRVFHFMNGDQISSDTNLALAKLSLKDDFGDFESKGESLVKLVEPELDSLGENWLAALRDHALLSLPPEFSSQLPHGGGAFYAGEAAEACRSHYAVAWPPLLYAAALRFNAQCATNTHSTETEALDNRPRKIENGNTDSFEPIDEKFHLLFGICMEALCAHRDTSASNAVTCLLSLMALLDDVENRARLMKDRSLAIELCCVLHRTGLTQECVAALLLSADVLHLAINAAKEDLQNRMNTKIQELAPEEHNGNNVPTSVLEAVQLLGEGGPTGDLPPGQSLLFSCLETALCLLVRRLPTLSPIKQKAGGTAGVIGVARGLGPHADTLLAKSLACMAQLPSLASPNGALSILPSLLYLGTGVVRAASGARGVGSALLGAVASRSKTLLSEHHESEAWRQLLQSTLATLVELLNEEGNSSSEVSWVGAKAMAVLLPHAAPPPALHYPLINHFRRCLDSEDPEVMVTVSECLRGLWRVGGVAWARALGPRLVARLATAPPPSHARHVAAVVAAVAAVEELVACAPEHGRTQMLWLLVPIVISYLRDSKALSEADTNVRGLHEFSLQWLTKIGPKYPQEFKSVMSGSPELRARLESAVKAGHAPVRPQHPAVARTQHAPTIQLKTDFSNFTQYR